MKYLRTERKVFRWNLHPSLVTLAVQRNRTLHVPQSWHHLSTAKATKPPDTNDATKPSHTNDTFLKPSRTNDATAQMLATNMVSFVRLFAESLAWGCSGVISV
ncbi:hypothetical protein TNCV_3014061 [Trichonephila clavipes]|nr:hypothetical protein TNCV_3014061 [Trichonephila clavipes]